MNEGKKEERREGEKKQRKWGGKRDRGEGRKEGKEIMLYCYIIQQTKQTLITSFNPPVVLRSRKEGK